MSESNGSIATYLEELSISGDGSDASADRERTVPASTPPDNSTQSAFETMSARELATFLSAVFASGYEAHAPPSLRPPCLSPEVPFVFTFYEWEWEAGWNGETGSWVRKFWVSRGGKGCGGYVRAEGIATDAPTETELIEDTRSRVEQMIKDSNRFDTQWDEAKRRYLSFGLSIVDWSEIPTILVRSRYDRNITLHRTKWPL